MGTLHHARYGLLQARYTPKTESQTYPKHRTHASVDKSSLSFSAKQGQTDVQELTVSGSNLKGAITATLSGANANMFSLSAPSLELAPGKLSVSYKPTAGAHKATLTLSSQGAADALVTDRYRRSHHRR